MGGAVEAEKRIGCLLSMGRIIRGYLKREVRRRRSTGSLSLTKVILGVGVRAGQGVRATMGIELLSWPS